ncbi:MAG: MMPL family transporter [Acidiferrobacteraceae bacterium]
MNGVRQHYIRMLTALVDFSRRRCIQLLVVAFVLTALALYYVVVHFAISTDTSGMLSRDLPFERLQNRFNKSFPQSNDTIVIVVKGESAGLSRRAAGRLSIWLKRHGAGITSVYQPGGGRFFERNGLLYLSTKDLWALSSHLSQAQPFLARLARKPTIPSLVSVLGEALGHAGTHGGDVAELGTLFQDFGKTVTAQESGRFFEIPWGGLMAGGSPTGGRWNFVVAKPRYDYRNVRPVQKAIDSIRRGVLALRLNAAHGVRVRITGSAALDNAQFKTISRSAGVAVGLSVFLVLALLTFALRTVRLVLATLVTLFIGLIWTAAFALFATGPFNLISIAFAVLFVGLGVDFGIQFCMRYREERLEHGHETALRRTVSGLSMALTLAALAAAISFYSFVPTRYAGIRDLGIISGTSMFIALIANFTVLPAMLSLTGVSRLKEHRFRRSLSLERVPIHRHVWSVLMLSGLVAVATIPMIMAARFDFDPMHLQNSHNEAVRTFHQLLKRENPSPYPIDVLEPNLASAERIAARLGKLDVVAHAVTLASYVPTHQAQKLAIIQQMALVTPIFALQSTAPVTVHPEAIRAALKRLQGELKAFVGREPRSGLAPAARRLQRQLSHYLRRFGRASQKLVGLQRRVIGDLPLELQALRRSLGAAPVTLDTLPASLRHRYLDPNGRARVQVFSRLSLNSNHNLRRFVAGVQKVAPTAIGTPILLVEGGDAVVQAFREATMISLTLIAILLLLALRRVTDVLMVLVSIGFAAMLTVAGMQLTGISFDLANIIVLPLEIGLCVAFGIYLVTRWRDGVEAAHLLRTSTPDAVLFSALTTLSSFGSLAVSSNPGMAVLGKTLCIAVTAILISILFLLPALLLLRTARPEGHETGGKQRE